MTRLRADLMLMACAVIWGVSFVFQKSVMDHIGVFTFMVFRGALAVAALAPFVLIEKQRSPAPLPPLFWKSAMLGAVALSFGTILQQIGIKTASVTNTGFLTTMYIVFTPVAAWLISRVVPPPIVLPAIALSVVGAWLLTGGAPEAMGEGELLVALGSLCWAVHMALMAYGRVDERPMTLPFVQFVATGLAAFPVALIFENPSFEDLNQALPAMLYIGVLTNALVYAALSVALRFSQPAEAVIILGTECVFSAIAGAVVYGDRLSATSWGGAALIVLAALLVQLVPVLRKP